MEIIDKRAERKIPIRDIEEGEIFEYDGEFFIMASDEDDYRGVCLGDGHQSFFPFDEPVVRCIGNITITK